tara:strand:+ start:22167 stop:22397 length:231 start_codon:yes stop_codon:yes gene_type:complete
MNREFTLSDIGNAVHNQKGYYWRLSEYLEDYELLDDDDANELCCRIEAFIDQEIEEIRQENPHKYDEEYEDYQYPF